MAEKDSSKMNIEELKQELETLLKILEEKSSAVRVQMDTVQKAIKNIEGVDGLLKTLFNLAQILKETKNSLSRLTKYGYYGAQNDDRPKAVCELDEWINIFSSTILAFGKITEHLGNYRGILLAAEAHIQKNRELIKKYSGLNKYFTKGYIKGLKIISLGRADIRTIETTLFLEVERIKMDIRKITESLDMQSSDIDLVKNAIITTQSIGVHIKKNINTWRRETASYGPFGAEYTKQLANVGIILKKLLEELTVLAKNETFIKATQIQIITISKSEMDKISGLERKFLGSKQTV